MKDKELGISGPTNVSDEDREPYTISSNNFSLLKKCRGRHGQASEEDPDVIYFDPDVKWQTSGVEKGIMSKRNMLFRRTDNVEAFEGNRDYYTFWWKEHPCGCNSCNTGNVENCSYPEETGIWKKQKVSRVQVTQEPPSTLDCITEFYSSLSDNVFSQPSNAVLVALNPTPADTGTSYGNTTGNDDITIGRIMSRPFRTKNNVKHMSMSGIPPSIRKGALCVSVQILKPHRIGNDDNDAICFIGEKRIGLKDVMPIPISMLVRPKHCHSGEPEPETPLLPTDFIKRTISSEKIGAVNTTVYIVPRTCVTELQQLSVTQRTMCIDGKKTKEKAKKGHKRKAKAANNAQQGPPEKRHHSESWKGRPGLGLGSGTVNGEDDEDEAFCDNDDNEEEEEEEDEEDEEDDEEEDEEDYYIIE